MHLPNQEYLETLVSLIVKFIIVIKFELRLIKTEELIAGITNDRHYMDH